MAIENDMAKALRELDPDSPAFPNALRELMVVLRGVPAGERPFTEIFQFMERHSDADFGSPGPIVHSLEALGGYEEALLESIRRVPIPHTLWMVNRILNGDVPAHERERWVAELGRVAADPSLPNDVRAEATDFLDHQRHG